MALSDDAARTIKGLIAIGYGPTTIAREFGVGRPAISQMKHGHTHAKLAPMPKNRLASVEIEGQRFREARAAEDAAQRKRFENAADNLDPKWLALLGVLAAREQRRDDGPEADATPEATESNLVLAVGTARLNLDEAREDYREAKWFHRFGGGWAAGDGAIRRAEDAVRRTAKDLRLAEQRLQEHHADMAEASAAAVEVDTRRVIYFDDAPTGIDNARFPNADTEVDQEALALALAVGRAADNGDAAAVDRAESELRAYLARRDQEAAVAHTT